MKHKNNLQPLASFIRHLRTESAFSQSDIATALGIEQSAYQRKESAVTRFKVEELELLAGGLFHTSIWELFWVRTEGLGFEEFVKEKGYLAQARYRQELSDLHDKIQSLENEIRYMKVRRRKSDRVFTAEFYPNQLK